MTEKKVVGSKNDFSKSCLKFCKGPVITIGMLELMWVFTTVERVNFTPNWLRTIFMYIICIINHAFLALEPPKIKIMPKNFIGIAHIA